MKKLALILVSVAFGAIAALASSAIAAGTVQGPGDNPPRWMTFPCPVEDSSGCYWDASVRGDGRGQSFYSIIVDRNTTHTQLCTVYWDKTFGGDNNFCAPAS